MKKLKQYFWDNIIAVLSWLGIGLILIVIFLPCILPAGKEFEAIIGVLIFYFGILYNILTYKISADKFSKELFNEFNKRFDDMNENLNRIVKGEYFYFAHKLFSLEDVIIDYMNLCAEECYWYKKGRVDNVVWESWKKGMIHYLKDPAFKAVVDDQRKEKDSYYGLYEELGL
ncbi:hypothetical protein LV84_03407 [Algoriphagus ratkowskyi]|uniref:Uncharacterized protein n=1 Tax=Algoriphagus ratkowskyi TaxID=57028 RepID=A0A2W7RAS1_9BACT|nr:hypothetical protein [Algoriphagus ratkowskyi]PZX52797.1 hypothetical protein LV84_03407 [Algoriphagus ratkowskyi]TXD76261.1 hypothetical protein ESW18_16910 [Algoriphagus ratkowskyi]